MQMMEMATVTACSDGISDNTNNQSGIEARADIRRKVIAGGTAASYIGTASCTTVGDKE